jgi:hypothetical protein
MKRVICAWAETCSGPGWANSLIWVVERDENGKLSQRAIQPEDQTRDMVALFGVSAACSSAMKRAVEAAPPRNRRHAPALPIHGEVM